MLPEAVMLILLAAGEFSSAPVDPPPVVIAIEDEAHYEEQHNLRLNADALGIIAGWRGDTMIIDMTGDPSSDEYKRADAFLSGYVIADAVTKTDDGCECLYYPGLTIEVLT